MNPFLEIENPAPGGPGTFEMALPLVQSLQIHPGMRVLEIGAGSGQVAAIVAKHWDVQVITLQPWGDSNNGIQAWANHYGVGNRVLSSKTFAQDMPFADEVFDAVFSINSFEMIGDDRPKALAEMIRVARKGARIGIAEPMCKSIDPPSDLPKSNVLERFQTCFRPLEWICELFRCHGLHVEDSYHFPEARQWWFEYRDQKRISEEEQELITIDNGRWISLGLVVGARD